MRSVNIEKEKIKKLYDESVDNSKWLIDHYQELAQKYNNKFIAVYNKQIVAVDEDPLRVLEILKEKGIDISTVTIDFVTTNPILYIL